VQPGTRAGAQRVKAGALDSRLRGNDGAEGHFRPS
jgi:hypothetical protein